MQLSFLAVILVVGATVVSGHRIRSSGERSALLRQTQTIDSFPRFPVTPSGEGLGCTGCELLVDVIYEASLTNATRQATIAELEAVCAAAFPNGDKLCDAIATLAVDELPKIVKAINELGYNDSHTVCSCLEYCTVPCCGNSNPTLPQQIHINWLDDMSTMSVAWTTYNMTESSEVMYGLSPSQLDMIQAGTQWTYTRGGWLGTLHSAVMRGLNFSTTYYYQVGSSTGGWSPTVYSFTTLPENPTTLRFATIGDMGSDHGDATIGNLIRAVAAGEIDAIIHNGDISYADGNEQNWDIFFRKMEPAIARVPYMTTAGNHELWWDFTAYKARLGSVMPWSQSGSSSSLYYSFQIGSLFHFVGFNTETAIDTADVDPTQVEWLKADLSSAASVNSRWRIAYAHRPMYCANTDKEQCTTFPLILQAQTEDIFRQYDVALVLTAHEHNYQRTWPVYKQTVTNTSYDNPTAPTYLVNGAGGNREGETTGWVKPMPEWMAFVEVPTGMGRLTVTEPSINFQFVSNANGVVDDFSITKP